MRREVELQEPLVIVNPNRGWVVEELDRLQAEWVKWGETVETLPVGDDYDPNTCTEAIMDGFANRRKHEVLREKTLVFLATNFSGYGFILETWRPHPHEDNTSRLKRIVPTWIHRMEILSASLQYARVTDGFWKERGKELVEQIARETPTAAKEIAASWLKNPFAGT